MGEFIPKLIHKELLRQLDYNPLTGYFYWKISNSPRIVVGDIAGTKNKIGYIYIRINKVGYRANRLAWFYYYGYWPENDVDHRDRIKHHNWILNLREASKSCNARNTGNPKDNTSGVKGVYWNKWKEKWEARLTINQKPKYLGYYQDFDNAVCARLAGEQCLNWEGCDSNTPAYKYVKENIQTYEYFCNNCGVLSGSVFKKPKTCLRCLSSDIIIGKPETLNLKELKEKWKNENKS